MCDLVDPKSGPNCGITQYNSGTAWNIKIKQFDDGFQQSDHDK